MNEVVHAAALFFSHLPALALVVWIARAEAGPFNPDAEGRE